MHWQDDWKRNGKPKDGYSEAVIAKIMRMFIDHKVHPNEAIDSTIELLVRLGVLIDPDRNKDTELKIIVLVANAFRTTEWEDDDE